MRFVSNQWKICCREAERLLQSLQALLEGAQGQLRLSAKTGNPALTAESAVLVIARLDEAYYALLEHHLSCGHDTPAVPPPHRYLPVIVAANPGESCLCHPTEAVALRMVSVLT